MSQSLAFAPLECSRPDGSLVPAYLCQTQSHWSLTGTWWTSDVYGITSRYPGCRRHFFRFWWGIPGKSWSSLLCLIAHPAPHTHSLSLLICVKKTWSNALNAYPVSEMSFGVSGLINPIESLACWNNGCVDWLRRLEVGDREETMRKYLTLKQLLLVRCVWISAPVISIDI